jgi:hypothetical protein
MRNKLSIRFIRLDFAESHHTQVQLCKRWIWIDISQTVDRVWASRRAPFSVKFYLMLDWKVGTDAPGKVVGFFRTLIQR